MPTYGRARVPTQGRSEDKLGSAPTPAFLLMKISQDPLPLCASEHAMPAAHLHEHDSMHGCRRRLLKSHSTLPHTPSQTSSCHLTLLDPKAPKPGPNLSGFMALLGTACVHDMKPNDAVSLTRCLPLVISLVIPKGNVSSNTVSTRDQRYP